MGHLGECPNRLYQTDGRNDQFYVIENQANIDKVNALKKENTDLKKEITVLKNKDTSQAQEIASLKK